jgi:hypothetical protein
MRAVWNETHMARHKWSYGCVHGMSAVDPKLHNRTSTLGEMGIETCSRCRIHLNSTNELSQSSVVLRAVNQPKFMGECVQHMEMCISQRWWGWSSLISFIQGNMEWRPSFEGSCLCSPIQPRNVTIWLPCVRLPLKKVMTVVRFGSHKTVKTVVIVWVQQGPRELHVEDVLAGASMVYSPSHLWWLFSIASALLPNKVSFEQTSHFTFTKFITI